MTNNVEHFSGAYWSFEYPLRWSVCSNFSWFSSRLSFSYWLVGALYIFWIEIPCPVYILQIPFSHLVILPFNSLHGVFSGLRFNVLQFISLFLHGKVFLDSSLRNLSRSWSALLVYLLENFLFRPSHLGIGLCVRYKIGVSIWILIDRDRNGIDPFLKKYMSCLVWVWLLYVRRPYMCASISGLLYFICLFICPWTNTILLPLLEAIRGFSMHNFILANTICPHPHLEKYF